jgi:hypothetical protein
MPASGTEASSKVTEKCPTFMSPVTRTTTESALVRPAVSVACRIRAYWPLSSKVGSNWPIAWSV